MAALEIPINLFTKVLTDLPIEVLTPISAVN
jgi:hypothetical protein